MRKAVLALFFAAVLAAAAHSRAAGEASPRLFSGIISDSECGLDHSRMKKAHNLPNDLKCTRVCCEKFQQEYVLADHTTGEVYQLDDQKKARQLANRIVRVLGTLDADSGTIHVLQIERVK
jgi:uncharacterized protein DUF5818